MGPMEVPADALYGASTMRAVLNFPISDLRFSRQFIRALGLIKKAAAEVNADLGLLDPRLAGAAAQAGQQVADGSYDEQFVVDIFQTGSGTSTNMNANEVIATIATEILGGDRGSKLVHPNDHVNTGQSSNDVIPTAIHVAALIGLKEELIPALEGLREALAAKSREYWPIIKTGRTHLQDATPVRLGQEFLGFAGQMERGLKRMAHAQEELSEVALGGTAVGTGVNCHPEFAARVCEKVSSATGVSIRETENHFQAQNAIDAIVEASSSIRTVALSLYKIANDITWMGTGPRAGIGELILPEVQPGSSIMPGKINPVIPEALLQVIAHVVGNDTTIVMCAQRSFFELNTMLPVAAHELLESITLLASATSNFTTQCVTGLEATSHGPSMVEKGLMLGTALAPVIGYDKAAGLAKEAAKSGRTIREVALEQTELTETELDVILKPEKMTEPGLGGGPSGG
ncbi:MAG: fumarate hydratase, class II [Chloroflexi bacterium]|nr:MAG: fumarate hydratase, class II [Chloroflexota bacterium]